MLHPIRNDILLLRCIVNITEAIQTAEKTNSVCACCFIDVFRWLIWKKRTKQRAKNCARICGAVLCLYIVVSKLACELLLLTQAINELVVL